MLLSLDCLLWIYYEMVFEDLLSESLNLIFMEFRSAMVLAVLQLVPDRMHH